MFLANRVVVLSKGRVLDEIAVDLPRPRSWDALIEDDDFKALSARVLQLVRVGLSHAGATRSRSTQGAHRCSASVVAYLAWQLWLTLAAPGKIAPGFPAGAGQVNILVTLPFPPERFHVLLFQTLRTGVRDARQFRSKFGE